MKNDNHGKNTTQGVSAQIAAGRQVVRDRGASTILSIIRRCVAPAPLGTLAVQLHDDQREITGRIEQRTPAQLQAWFTEQGALVQPDKDQQSLIVLDIGRDARKRKEDVQSRQILFLDHDKQAPAVDKYVELLGPLGLAFIAHQSWSHTDEAPRTHGLIFLAEPIVFSADRTVDDVRLEQAFIGGVFAELLDADLDAIHGTAGRIIYAGNRPSETAPARRVVGQDGGGLRWDHLIQGLGYEAPVDLQLEPPDDEEKGPLPTIEELTARHPEPERLERFKTYLSTCAPCVPQMKPDGAGAQCLRVMRAGIRGLLLDADTVVDTVLESSWNRKCSDGKGQRYPWKASELQHKATRAADDDFDKPPGWLLIERDEKEGKDPKFDRTDYSDLGIARRIVAEAGDDIRVVRMTTDSGDTTYRWFVWNGKHWRPDSIDSVIVGTTTRISAEIEEGMAKCDEDAEAAKADKDIAAEKDAQKHKANLKKIRDSVVAGRRITSIRLVLQTQEPIQAERKVFDADPMLLGCPSCTVDLRTGKKRMPRREDYITMSCAVDPADTSAGAAVWKRFLFATQGGKEGTRDPRNQDAEARVKYLQRILGYSITGLRSTHAYFVWKGAGEANGGNGKGTVLTTLQKHVGGDYIGSLTLPNVVEHKDALTQHPTGLKANERKRMVIVGEVREKACTLDDRVKELASEDPIPARGMGKDMGVIEWDGKLFFQSQYVVRVKDPTQDAWQRRANAMHWRVNMPKALPLENPGEQLAKEAPAILRWLIDGAVAWYANRHKPLKFKDDVSSMQPHETLDDPFATPVSVRCETIKDLAYCDNLQAFLIDCSTTDAEAQVEAGAFYAAYERWAKAEGFRDEEILKSNVLGRSIRDKNYGLTSERDRNHTRTFYKGRRLNDLGPHAARRAS